jgi:hypothetical protein
MVVNGGVRERVSERGSEREREGGSVLSVCLSVLLLWVRTLRTLRTMGTMGTMRTMGTSSSYLG